MNNDNNLMRVPYKWKNQELYQDDTLLGALIIGEMPGLTYSDKLEQIEEGVFKWSRHFKNESDQPIPLQRFTFAFQTSYETTWHMIPAVSYNGNSWGKGLEPKGFEHQGEPWSFAYHRTAIPGATYSEGKYGSVALFGAFEGLGFSCSLLPKTGHTTHELIWPLMEGPMVYIEKDAYDVGYESRVPIEPLEAYCMTAYLIVNPITDAEPSYSKMLEFVWRLNDKPQKPWFNPEQLWELGIRYVKESLWAEEGIFRGTSIGLTWNGEQWEQRKSMKYKIGWTGQNISLANSLLHDYIRTKDSSSLEKGLSALDCWAEHAKLSCGLLRCHFDYILDNTISKPELQDACHLAASAMNFFEAYELAIQCGVDKPQYLETAIGVCDFVVHCQSDSGRIGKVWNNEGECIDPEGTIGSYLIAPLIKCYHVTKKQDYLQAAELGYCYYIQELLQNGYTTAGALDTYCIDKESAIPLLEAGLELFETTHDPKYITWATKAAWYLTTWQWHHTVTYQDNGALQAMSYDTFGGTAVSTQHHHIDPYGIKYVIAFLKLSRITGNTTWTNRAKAIWSNGSIGISDGTLVVMDKLRPIGSQDEGFYHTMWRESFQVSQWLVAWPTAFRLETLRQMNDWSLLE